VINSNLGRISHRFRDMAIQLPIWKFSTQINYKKNPAKYLR